MSSRSKFIIGIIVLFTAFLIAEYRMPRKYQWVPTFAHNDPQPFGCMVFDSVLAASMPHGYTVERRTLWQMEKDSVFKEPKAVMIVTEEDIDNQRAAVLRLASKGNTMLVATTDLYRWADTLGIDYNYNNPFRLSEIAGKNAKKGLLLWKNDTLCQWSVYVQIIERTLEIPDSIKCEQLASFFGVTVNSKNKNALPVVAVSFRIGDGELILVSAPLLLTNYMMLSGDGHLFIARLMDRLKHLPVIRTESYMSGTAQTEQTPLYVLLKEPPLRWAVYLTMLTILLFCIFTARRRQRVIPVIRQPQNGNLEFARLIGSLYWQQHDNAGLLAKKLAYTAEELRRQTGIDITVPGGLPAGPLYQLSALTGRNPEDLRLLLKNIQQAATGNYTVSDQELKTYIDELDNLLHSL
ncbi:MAG: DUF4350 domain-containing protein [Prevotella sp.]|nr:DUF4350 domain-containing protein [Prevotella sp.]